MTRKAAAQVFSRTRDGVHLWVGDCTLAVVDEADFDLVGQYYWGIHRAHGDLRYALTRVRFDPAVPIWTPIFMHRMLLGNPPAGFDIDHINGNALDNRRANLRMCRHKDNIRSQRKNAKASSRFKGVSWSKLMNKWHAYIMKDYKRIHLGFHDDEAVAAQTYNAAARELFGDFARLNEIG